MTHKTPTERVAPTTLSAHGLVFQIPKKEIPTKDSRNLAGNCNKSKPLTSPEQESCANSLKFRPLPKKYFYQLIDQRLEDFLQAAIRRWNSRPARLRKAMRRCVELMLRRGQFAQGERIAYSRQELAEHAGYCESTISRALKALEQLSDHIRVLRIVPGERSYDGKPARKAHLEFELGPALCRRSTATCSVASSLRADHLRRTNQGVARCSGTGSTMLPDHFPNTDQINPDQIIELKNQPPKRTELPNFEELTEKANQRNVTAVSKRGTLALRKAHRPLPASLQTETQLQQGNKNPLSTSGVSSQLQGHLSAAITQHRRIAEAKGQYVPISEQEMAVMAHAWQQLPKRISVTDKLALFAEVSELALADSRRNGRATASLRYTFAVRDNGQNPLLDRVCRLREDRIAKEQAAHAERYASLASALFGTPNRSAPTPVALKRNPRGPKAPARSVLKPRKVRSCAPDEQLLSPKELLQRLNAFTAQTPRATG